MAWLDNAGLYQKFGTEQTVTAAGGEYKTYGELREIEFKITLSAVPTGTGTIIPGTDNIFMPAGVMVEEVQTIADTAATGATATLNLGLIRTDRTTEIDFNGLLAAAPLANMDVTGERFTYTAGVAGAGALVGAATVGSNPGYFCADWDTAAFTAGVITVRIKYRKQ